MSSMNAPVDIVVRGRGLDISQRFREHVGDKLARVDKFGVALSRIDVEVSKETNPRQADRAFEVESELAARGKAEMLKAVREVVPARIKCIYVRQPQALGLGHAVMCAQPVVGEIGRAHV